MERVTHLRVTAHNHAQPPLCRPQVWTSDLRKQHLGARCHRKVPGTTGRCQVRGVTGRCQVPQDSAKCHRMVPFARPSPLGLVNPVQPALVQAIILLGSGFLRDVNKVEVRSSNLKP